MKQTVDILTEYLGYKNDVGFIDCSSFAHLPNHRHALRIAKHNMSVVSAFGLWTGSNGAINQSGQNRFTPLVFISYVEDEDDAMKVHRSVWSQRLTPYLVIISPKHIRICQGFQYSSSNWEKSVIKISVTEFMKITNGDQLSDLFSHLFSKNLRSSICWPGPIIASKTANLRHIS